MESGTLETIGLGLAAIGLILAAVWQLSFMWLDPRKETDAEKRRREKREKKSGVQAQISRGAEPVGGEEKPPSAADRVYFNSLGRWR